MPKVQLHKGNSQKTFFEFHLNTQLCLIFTNMSKTGSLLDYTAVSAGKGPFCQQISHQIENFCLNSVLKEKVLKVLLTFSQNYSIIKHKVIELTIK